MTPSDERWVAFTETMPSANIFHHPAWIELLAKCYRFRPFVLVTFDAAGKIVAGLPFLAINSIFTGRRWVSLPYSDYCPPLFTDEEALNKLTDALVQLSQEKRVPRIYVRWEFPPRPAITPYSIYVLHRLALQTSTEQQGRRLDGMHRQNVRTARKQGVTIERGTDLEHIHKFYRLQLETRQRKGLPAQPWRFFRLLKQIIFDRGLGFTMLAYKGDDCIAGGVFLHWHHSIMFKYAASREETLELRPNNLLFWTAITWGCENGYEIFDMGRSDLDNAGLREFKSRWGAQETPLLYSTVSTPVPAQHDGPAMALMGAAIRRSPLWLTRISGELLYRHFD
jgi:CelD/BcsL family acetyltransferase involved in cellulose biosynthesis